MASGKSAEAKAIEAQGPGNADASDDGRMAPRVTLLLRTAKLKARDREFLCIIRDVSATGIRLRLFHPLPEGATLVLETGNGDRYPLEPVWSYGENAGFRFLERINLGRLLKGPYEKFPKRQIRLRQALNGTIALANGPVDVTFENISQQGACVKCDRHLAIDQMIVLKAGGLPPVQAKVRWRRRPHYGLIFEQTFQIEELARLLAP